MMADRLLLEEVVLGLVLAGGLRGGLFYILFLPHD